MDLDKLNYVISIGEERSFSKAAKKLFISQPALSQYISSLENELGIKLFNRDEYPISITKAGEIFIQNSKQILNLKRNMIREINFAKDNSAGTLKIGISPFRSSQILPKLLVRMKEQFPNVKIIILESHSKEVENSLEKGEVDIGIMSLPVSGNRFSYIEFYTDEIYLITPRNNHFLKLATNNTISLQDLEDENFILPYRQNKLREKLEATFSTYNFVPNTLMETETQECLLSLIEEGLGIGFASKMSLNFKNRKNDLYHFSLKEGRLVGSIGAVFKSDRTLSIFEESLIKILIEEIGNQVE